MFDLWRFLKKELFRGDKRTRPCLGLLQGAVRGRLHSTRGQRVHGVPAGCAPCHGRVRGSSLVRRCAAVFRASWTPVQPPHYRAGRGYGEAGRGCVDAELRDTIHLCVAPERALLRLLCCHGANYRQTHSVRLVMGAQTCADGLSRREMEDDAMQEDDLEITEEMVGALPCSCLIT